MRAILIIVLLSISCSSNVIWAIGFPTIVFTANDIPNYVIESDANSITNSKVIDYTIRFPRICLATKSAGLRCPFSTQTTSVIGANGISWSCVKPDCSYPNIAQSGAHAILIKNGLLFIAHANSSGNPVAILQANIDKNYLCTLQADKVSVICVWTPPK